MEELLQWMEYIEDVRQASILSVKHPKNNNIRAKIRQQLQQLRDRGVISFLGNGLYQKINSENLSR